MEHVDLCICCPDNECGGEVTESHNAASAMGERISVDLLIRDGILITMDSMRKVVDRGSVAVIADRIVEIGSVKSLDEKYRAANIIDVNGKIVMPGLIDGHGHAGHSLVKTLGVDRPGGWEKACEEIYTVGSTEEFWHIDGLLLALERLRFGVTCGVTFFADR
jgi:5-methylthioadenosine/S-adenosylhomocysteine deaminase